MLSLLYKLESNGADIDFEKKYVMQETMQIDLMTARLFLRKIGLNDRKELFDIRFHPQVLKFIRRAQLNAEHEMNTYIKDRVQDIEQGQICYWGITKLKDSKLIGTICLWNFKPDKTEAEIGYELHPDAQQKGYASEGMTAVLDFGFSELKLSSIKACTHQKNEPSKVLLTKFGFELAFRFRR